jgi:hypothetical protein
MKALSAYQKVFSSYEQGKLSALEGSMQLPFFSNYTEKIDKYLDDIDREDVIKELQGLKKGGANIKVKNWCPLKSEGFHSLFLEKHILYRYAAYDKEGFSNVSKLYENEKTATQDRIKVVKDVTNFMPSWAAS